MLKTPRGRPKKSQPQPTQSQNPQQSESLSENTGYSANDLTEETQPQTKAEKKPRGRGAAQKAQMERIRPIVSKIIKGSGAIAMRANQNDGVFILLGEPDLTEAICNLAEEDKTVRDFLLSMGLANAWTGVAMASLAIILPIMANHNLLPPLFAPSIVSVKEETVSGLQDTSNN